MFDAWLATISGTEDVGPLAAIAHAADGTSVAQDLSGGVRTLARRQRRQTACREAADRAGQMVRTGTILSTAQAPPGSSPTVACGSYPSAPSTTCGNT